MAETLALLTAFTIPLLGLVTFLLWRVARQNPDNPILRERAVVETAVAVLVTVFTIVFLNNDQPIPPLDTDMTKIITRGTVFLVAVIASGYWLFLYLRPEPPNGERP